jgi:hypothetical protein
MAVSHSITHLLTHAADTQDTDGTAGGWRCEGKRGGVLKARRGVGLKGRNAHGAISSADKAFARLAAALIRFA